MTSIDAASLSLLPSARNEHVAPDSLRGRIAEDDVCGTINNRDADGERIQHQQHQPLSLWASAFSARFRAAMLHGIPRTHSSPRIWMRAIHTSRSITFPDLVRAFASKSRA